MTDTKILEAHFAASRARLVAEGAIANAYNHKGNIGSIREAFVRELLENCTSKFCSVGAGEIIHRDMTVDEPRNQMDVVLYNNRYPKIPGAGGVDMFFVEAVSATVEVKSCLTKKDIRQAAQASKRIKSYPKAPPQRFNPNGSIPRPHPYCFLFAYDANAASIKTVEKWMREVSEEDDYDLKHLAKFSWQARKFAFHSFLNGIFVLNKGYILADSVLFGHPKRRHMSIIDYKWHWSESDELERMWMTLTMLSEEFHWNDLDLAEYSTPHTKYIPNLKVE